MKCPVCGNQLRIASNKFVSDKDSTDVYSEQTVVCANDDYKDGKPCPMYAGKDLSKPLAVVQTVRTKVG